MKKILLCLLLLFGLASSVIPAIAQDNPNDDTTKIEEDETPEANRRPSRDNTVLNFGLFAVFVVAVGATVTFYKNKNGMFYINSAEMNGDGSYTITVRSSAIKKMIENPDDVHVIIRKGTCIFLKKPDFSKQLTKKDDLFVLVVNENSEIEFVYKEETFTIDGSNLGKSLKLKNSTI